MKLPPLFEKMREKDPDLFGRIEMMPVEMGMWAWVEKYPDDFPARGMTALNDASAIKDTFPISRARPPSRPRGPSKSH
jgi:hypothetical protein